jgi:hypothetical protein
MSLLTESENIVGGKPKIQKKDKVDNDISKTTNLNNITFDYTNIEHTMTGIDDDVVKKIHEEDIKTGKIQHHKNPNISHKRKSYKAYSYLDKLLNQSFLDDYFTTSENK